MEKSFLLGNFQSWGKFFEKRNTLKISSPYFQVRLIFLPVLMSV